MTYDPLMKKPAFFPSVSAEIFFEAEDDAETDDTLETACADLDKELDEILETSAA